MSIAENRAPISTSSRSRERHEARRMVRRAGDQAIRAGQVRPTAVVIRDGELY
jgi:hypothetical protein